MAIEARELTKLKYSSFPEIFDKVRTMAADYNVPLTNLISMFGTDGYSGAMYASPQVMNRRFENIGSSPINYTKNQVAEMLKHPQTKERELREASRGLDYTSYTYRHMRRTYSSLLTYHNYVAPSLIEESEIGDSFGGNTGSWTRCGKPCAPQSWREKPEPRLCWKARPSGPTV